MLSTTPVFTAGNAKTQTTETKHVINRELCVPLQLPVGDDVSGLQPLRSSASPHPASARDAGWKPNKLEQCRKSCKVRSILVRQWARMQPL
jgi:hypothetical protein